VLTYNPANNRLSSFTPAGSATPIEIGYDGSGQRIAQGSASNKNQTRFSYMKTGRLASFAASATPGASASVAATYTYDALGQRRQSAIRDSASKVTTMTWDYDGLELLGYSASRSDNTTWSVTYLYDGAGRPYAGIYADSSANKAHFYMVTSDRGDVVSLLASNGLAFASYRYDQWGNPTATSTQALSSISAPLAALIAERQVLRYAGYVWDAESKTYYCSARNYDPATMQFLSKDPVKADGEESAYQYCGGDPVGKVDPTGASSAKRDIYLGAHHVAAWQYHTCVLILTYPNGTASYVNRKFETLGAGPVKGKLVSGKDRGNDKNLKHKKELILLKANASKETVDRLFARESYYRNKAIKVIYAATPGKKSKEYKSNSFTHGLLQAAGVSVKRPKSSVPGWDKPLPKSYFGVK